MTEFGKGWLKSPPDNRDIIYGVAADPASQIKLPDKVDLRPEFTWDPYHQLDMNACTAHASIAAYRFSAKKQGLPPIIPSRMFAYWVSRKIDGRQNQDSGATMRAACKAIANYGVPEEKLWPYQPHKVLQSPPDDLYKDAVQNMVKLYMRLNPIETDLKTCLAQGYPFLMGMMVYKAFESDQVAATGMVPEPSWMERPPYGHAMLCVGYGPIKGKRYYVVLNSWGKSWGDGGYCYLPETVMHSHLCDDFWTIRTLEGPDPNRKWKAA
jgi:C1A family cysteine protease